MTSDPTNMEAVKIALEAILREASFDVESTEITHDGRNKPIDSQRVSAPQLREVYFAEEESLVERRVSKNVPEELMSELADCLRVVLERVIDPETDRIGHAFQLNKYSGGGVSTRADGLKQVEYTSQLQEFADALVQAAAVIGIQEAMRLLEAWERGEPIQSRICTVLNNLFIDSAIHPREGVEVVPLPLTTDKLPRLPFGSSASPADYLGHPMLSLRLEGSPAFFRPKTGQHKNTVHFRSAGDINLDIVCSALSLQANRHVEQSVNWHVFPEAAAFCLTTPSPWSPGMQRLEQICWKQMAFHDRNSGITLIPSDDTIPQCLDQDELARLLEALRKTDRKIRIAVERWSRSKHPVARLEDRYIDLRIALELLYLKDFANEHSGELRFRLSLIGAWHLGKDLDERRSIRKTLRDAYDTASKAVHLGEPPRTESMNLSEAQDLCRRGLLKLLLKGPPDDWGDLTVGAEFS